jgi:hypothetical protein
MHGNDGTGPRVLAMVAPRHPLRSIGRHAQHKNYVDFLDRRLHNYFL